jgi:hypothetical protein
LLVTISLFIFFVPKDMKRDNGIWKEIMILRFLTPLLLYLQVPHMLFTLNPHRKVWIFQVTTVRYKMLQDKFKIIYNSIVICAQLNKIYLNMYYGN